MAVMRLNFKRMGLLGAHAARALARTVQLTSARCDLMTVLLTRARRQREIAALLCVSEGVISRMVAALEQQGLVQRSTPTHDKRVRIVALTDAGRARLAPIANDEEDMLWSDGRESAQGWGELAWLVHWEDVLDQLGLGALLPLSCSQDTSVELRPPTPPFWAMQAHLRAGCLRGDSKWCERVDVDDLSKLVCRATRWGAPRARKPSWA